jgi:hypothetical protein
VGKYIVSLTIVLFLGYHQHPKKETMYFLFRGDRFVSLPDLVFKNNSRSFVDSIMPVGEPFEYLMTVNSFANLKQEIAYGKLFDQSKNGNLMGVLVIFYDYNKKSKSYLFSTNSEIKELISAFEKNLTGKTGSESVKWLYEECKIHKVNVRPKGG